jgi:4,5-dihydroxyphthalate decarboxylase
MVSRGDDRLVGLPIFLSRAFRHSQVYVNVDSGISSPEDLRSRRVGIPEYQMTAALWIRAFLQHDYGVAPSDVDWWTGGLMTPQYRERLGHSVPEDVSLRRIPEDRALEEMLEVGDLDALVTARAPVPFLGGSSKIRRLFPNYVEVERDYHRRTGFFPIMHAVAMRRSTYEANPWIATALLDAFEQAKRVSLERLHDQDTLPVMHPWMDATLDQIHDEFQGDPFVYGFEPNQEILDAMVSYSVEQGLAQRRLRPQDLMAPESLDWRP